MIQEFSARLNRAKCEARDRTIILIAHFAGITFTHDRNEG